MCLLLQKACNLLNKRTSLQGRGRPAPAGGMLLDPTPTPGLPASRLIHMRCREPDSRCPSLPSGTQLEKMMESMRNDVASHPPVEGSYAPRRGEFCIAKFVDGEW